MRRSKPCLSQTQHVTRCRLFAWPYKTGGRNAVSSWRNGVASVTDRPSAAMAPVNQYISAHKSKAHQISVGSADHNSGILVVRPNSRPPHRETGGEIVELKSGSVASGSCRRSALLSARFCGDATQSYG